MTTFNVGDRVLVLGDDGTYRTGTVNARPIDGLLYIVELDAEIAPGWRRVPVLPARLSPIPTVVVPDPCHVVETRHG